MAAAPSNVQIVNTEEIGSSEILHLTKASQCIIEGKGLEEGTVGGEKQFVLTTKNAQGSQRYCKHDRVEVEIRNEEGQQCTREIRINDNKNGRYQVSYSTEEQGRYTVTVKVNGGHVRGSPFTFKGQLFQFKAFFGTTRLFHIRESVNRPRGVAVNAKDEIAVSDYGNRKVHVFSSDGKCLKSFTRQGDKNGEFFLPAGIAFDKNGDIYVADYGSARIQIFSGEGKYKSSFGGKGRLDSHFSNFWGVSVDSGGNVIVADAGNKFIKIFSPDGELKTIGGKGSFSYPFHCIQCDGYLIVSDNSEHCVKVYDWDGKFQNQFGKWGDGDGEFKSPTCLSVNKSGHLMVCDSGNNRIQVFQLDGTFVGKFGSKGKNLGQFESPWATAVLSNGHIVVSDQNNDRMQIFK